MFMKNNFILKNKKQQEWHFFTFLKSSLVSGLLEDAWFSHVQFVEIHCFGWST